MKDKDFITEFLGRFGYAEWRDEVFEEEAESPYGVTIFTIESFNDTDTQRLAQFVRDVLKREEEDKLRSSNPTLKHAYDEYLILLKLSK